MKEVNEANFITGQGMEGDRHLRSDGRRSNRQVLIMDSETLNHFDLSPGQVRENVTVEGLDFSSISAGDKVSLGGDVILEVTGDCEPCARMDELRPGLKDEIDGKRGLLAFVEKGGVVSVGAEVGVNALKT
ncbi:MAG: MOSC domain-containing protein [Dehalococcoidia bacterium]|tara:strand:+ start:1689 stop:2081 length:393 start_codon:yes stop_codon:yes gene_type:complete